MPPSRRMEGIPLEILDPRDVLRVQRRLKPTNRPKHDIRLDSRRLPVSLHPHQPTRIIPSPYLSPTPTQILHLDDIDLSLLVPFRAEHRRVEERAFRQIVFVP